MMTEINKQKEKGFTLIELMIVVAIIGILAAIAIPQFSAYRIKAFNAAAQSDVHTARLASEALYTDLQAYGATVATTGTAGAAGAGAVITTNGFVAGATAGQEVPITLSNNVNARIDTLAGRGSAIGITKHTQGDAVYAFDTDASALYFDSAPTWASITLTATIAAGLAVPSVVNRADDFTGIASGGNGNWIAK